MRELFLRQVSVEDEPGGVHCFDYSILIDEMDVGPFFCESYGLQVKEQGSERICAVPHITTSISRIDELCELVLSGGVTPSTLQDVVHDWLYGAVMAAI